MDLKFVKALALVKILIMDHDPGQVNHLLEVRDDLHRDILISYSGKSELGQEGDFINIRWTGNCHEVIGCEEMPSGPVGHRAWVCDADWLEKLGEDQ